jgi:Tol biopolymer transport system component
MLASAFLVGSIFLSAQFGCKDEGTAPVSFNQGPPADGGRNILCYEKSFNGSWEVFTNNIVGSNPRNISHHDFDDEYPLFSPDGRYIAYLLNGAQVSVYDCLTGASVNLGEAHWPLTWTPNGKLCFIASSAVYVMNPDGIEKKKILDSQATIYFFRDNDTFLYRSTLGETKVYKTNLDHTLNEFVLDIEPPGQFLTIRDFNCVTGELLVNTNAVPGSASAIATFNVQTKQLTAILKADEGYEVYLQRYSKDFSTIAFIEHSSKDEFLSVVSGGVKKRLVRIPASTPAVSFSYNGMAFSPDGKYIAFSELVYGSGVWLSLTEYLYVVDVSSGALYFVDKGFYPSWKAY